MRQAWDDPRGIIKATKAAWTLPRLNRMGCPVSGRELIDWWFNGELFHRDDEKRAKIDDLRVAAGDQNVRSWLVLGLTFSRVVLTEFHTFLRDETDLYDNVPVQ
ncbi:MAG: hypothetical protein HYV07_30555 [Deltaproteobacteria bacterium]|nr:hypothetical protein [Deltaproteobacteria bacterium]